MNQKLADLLGSIRGYVGSITEQQLANHRALELICAHLRSALRVVDVGYYCAELSPEQQYGGFVTDQSELVCCLEAAGVLQELDSAPVFELSECEAQLGPSADRFLVRICTIVAQKAYLLVLLEDCGLEKNQQIDHVLEVLSPSLRGAYRSVVHQNNYRLQAEKIHICTYIKKMGTKQISMPAFLEEMITYMVRVLDLESAFVAGKLNGQPFFVRAGGFASGRSIKKELLEQVLSSPVLKRLLATPEQIHTFKRQYLESFHAEYSRQILSTMEFNYAYVMLPTPHKNSTVVIALSAINDSPLLQSGGALGVLPAVLDIVGLMLACYCRDYKQELFYENFFDLDDLFSNQGLVFLDNNGHITKLNREAAGLLQLAAAPETLIGTHIEALLEPDMIGFSSWQAHRNRPVLFTGHLTRAGTSLGLRVLRLRTETGSAGFLAWIYPDSQQVARVPSAPVRANAQLPTTQLEKQLRELVASFYDIVWVADKDGHIAYLNQSFCTVLGFEVNEYLGHTIAEVFFQGYNDGQATSAQILELIRAGRARHIQSQLDNSKGDPVHLDVNVSPFYEQGQVTGYYGWAHNITAEKYLYMELYERERYWRELTESVNDIIYILDCDLNVYMLNSQWANITGISKSEILGKNLADFVEERDRLKVERNFQKVFSQQVDLHFRFRICRSQGDILHLDAGASPMLDKDKKIVGVWGVIRDVSELVSMTEELRLHTVELERLVEERTSSLEVYSRKLQWANSELEEFVYVVSHDLKAPLRAIAGFSQFLLEDYGELLPDDGLEYLDRMQVSAKHMSTLINDLLELSRLNRTKICFTKIDLGSKLRKVIEMISAGKHISFSVKRKLPEVFADELRIRQVFLNLISNAIKFSPPDNICIEVDYLETPDYHQISIKDNGIGVEEKYFEQIFGMFQRLHTKDEYEGNGIGLGLVKKIITKHRGRIWVESTPGQGATFFFTIWRHLDRLASPDSEDLTPPWGSK